MSNWPNIAQQQKELSDLSTPFRLVQDYWFEFDAGEITVADEEKLTSLRFLMVELTESLLWKSGMALFFLDHKDHRSRYLRMDKIGESSLLHRQLHSVFFEWI